MTDALAAALLASQRGQQQQFDPAANSRRFAQQLTQQGASTAPVAHPVEGIARALQGGLGGLGGLLAGAAGGSMLNGGLNDLLKKLDQHGPSLIHTVRGVGYTLRAPRS